MTEPNESIQEAVVEAVAETAVSVARGVAWFLLRLAIVLVSVLGYLGATFATGGLNPILMPVSLAGLAGLLFLWKRDWRDGLAAAVGAVTAAVVAGFQLAGEEGTAMHAIVVGICAAGLVLLWELFALLAP